MSKRYRLLKDLPDIKAGMEFTMGQYFYISGVINSEGDTHDLRPRYVENNPEWFEEIKEPKRIFVYLLDQVSSPNMGINSTAVYRFHTDKYLIPKEKFTAIKSAIEKVINEDGGEEIEKLWAVADLLSRCWHYGDMKIETANERTIFGLLSDLKLYPTSESYILIRKSLDKFFDMYKNIPMKYETTRNRYSKSEIEQAERNAWDAARKTERRESASHIHTNIYQTFEDYKKQNP